MVHHLGGIFDRLGYIQSFRKTFINNLDGKNFKVLPSFILLVLTTNLEPVVLVLTEQLDFTRVLPRRQNLEDKIGRINRRNIEAVCKSISHHVDCDLISSKIEDQPFNTTLYRWG